MIPDERLSVLISGIDLENISPHDIIDMAEELLILRPLRDQKQRLIEDGERMAKAINRSLDHFVGIDKSDYIEVANELSESYEFHNALLKELEEKK